MPVDLISEEELRLALNRYRVDPARFEEMVSARVDNGAEQDINPLAAMSPLAQVAASFLPLEVFGTGRALQAAFQPALAAGVLSKLVAYVAFPAISLFVLLGSAVFGAARVRKIQNAGNAEAGDGAAPRTTSLQWWRDHRWGRWLLYAATIALAWYGATWMLFLGYIVSTLILIYVLKSLADVGLGNRVMVGDYCALGLVFLGQAAGFAGIGARDIHLIDQALLVPLFFAGALVISILDNRDRNQWPRALQTGMFGILTLVVTVWFMNPILRPASPARIVGYVESFDRAEFSSVSWRHWEIVTSWALRYQRNLDLSRPRRLLAEEMAHPENPVLPYILGSAFRTGLVEVDQIGAALDYDRRLGALLQQPVSLRISALEQEGWLIRAALLRHDLTPEQQNYLAARLHVTLRSFLTRPNPGPLQEPLLATQLLEVLGQPVDPALYRADMQALLMRFHSRNSGGFQRAGGFKAYENLGTGELEATADAVRLMEVYGVPKNLDVNWVRSFLRPSFTDFPPQNWIAAVSRDRLSRLPGVTPPSWFEVLYYERNFVAALILIGLCLYATVISPEPPAHFKNQ